MSAGGWCLTLPILGIATQRGASGKANYEISIEFVDIATTLDLDKGLGTCM